MIRSFGDSRTEDIFNGNRPKRLDVRVLQRAQLKLNYIHAAGKIEDLMVPPSNRLEKKKGDLKDFYAIRVNDQYRIIFRWKNGEAYDVQFMDYH